MALVPPSPTVFSGKWLELEQPKREWISSLRGLIGTFLSNDLMYFALPDTHHYHINQHLMLQGEAIREKLHQQLLQLNVTGFTFKNISASIDITKRSLHQLNELVLTQGFGNSEEEIYYFKSVLPDVFGHLIFYLRLIHIESSISAIGGLMSAQFHEKEKHRIQSYFERHLHLYRYYRLGLTYLDDKYFMRPIHQEQYLADNCALLDSRLSTPMSQRFARFKAYDMLMEFLQPSANTGQLGATNLVWAAQKVQLAELIYALDSIKAFGNVNTMVLTDMICKCWNVHLSFIHKTFEEIRLRKKNRTPFLDHLKLCLLQRMEQDDDK
ncbi:RteC domain-containing protein [Niastella sp. OAS944]|uniref:RteC domain-containing protein n=1 Tax=Niastella sp. OAS944 TaxID=2664089 RepID=UPI003483BE0E|nr:hypothetical protein [Chitinophagaceae bacterium OAS944]